MSAEQERMNVPHQPGDHGAMAQWRNGAMASTDPGPAPEFDGDFLHTLRRAYAALGRLNELIDEAGRLSGDMARAGDAPAIGGAFATTIPTAPRAQPRPARRRR